MSPDVLIEIGVVYFWYSKIMYPLLYPNLYCFSAKYLVVNYGSINSQNFVRFYTAPFSVLVHINTPSLTSALRQKRAGIKVI